jgi:serine/threonine protein kinase
LHGKGYMHADLKPENIVLNSRTMQPSLIDFNFSDTPKSHMGGGTPKYVAPEMRDDAFAIGDNNRGFSSDVFSLGMLFYYILKQEDIYEFSKLPKTVNRWEEILNVFNSKDDYLIRIKKAFDALEADKIYPAELLILMKNMVNFEGSNRPMMNSIIPELEKIQKDLCPVSDAKKELKV